MNDVNHNDMSDVIMTDSSYLSAIPVSKQIRDVIGHKLSLLLTPQTIIQWPLLPCLHKTCQDYAGYWIGTETDMKIQVQRLHAKCLQYNDPFMIADVMLILTYIIDQQSIPHHAKPIIAHILEAYFPLTTKNAFIDSKCCPPRWWFQDDFSWMERLSNNHLHIAHKSYFIHGDYFRPKLLSCCKPFRYPLNLHLVVYQTIIDFINTSRLMYIIRAESMITDMCKLERQKLIVLDKREQTILYDDYY